MKICWQPRHPILCELFSAFLRAQTRVYVVGGAVRDYLLKEQYHPHKAIHFASAGGQKVDIATDIDLLLPGQALPTARAIADQCGWAYYPLDQERVFVRLVYPLHGEQLICDVAGLGLQAFHGGAEQHEVILSEALRLDLNNRDFTINAMVFAFESTLTSETPNRYNPDDHAHCRTENGFAAELIDPHDGRTDLMQGIVRRVSPDSLDNDSVRLLRAVRFAIQFDFKIEKETLRQLEKLSGAIEHASDERIRDELWKGLSTRDPASFIDLLRTTGLLTYVLPEVANLINVEQSFPHFLDVYQHTLLAVRHAARLRDWLLCVSLSGTDGQGNDTSVYAGNQIDNGNQLDDQQVDELLWSTLKARQQELSAHIQSSVAGGHRRAQWLVWYALFHDVGKPSCQSFEQTDNGVHRIRFVEHEQVGADLTKKRLETLRFSRQEIALATIVVRGHMRSHLLHTSAKEQSLSRRSMYLFFQAARVAKSEPNVQDQEASTDHVRIAQSNQVTAGIDIVLLALADYQAIYAQLTLAQWQHYLAHIGQLVDFAFSPSGLTQVMHNPLINGRDLIQLLDMKPGPRLGQMLKQLAEAQASGDITTREEALDLAHKLSSSARN